MTNQQLYLAVGLPTLTSLMTLILVVLAWLSSHSAIKELRADMDRLERRLDQRFEAIDQRFEAIDRQLEIIAAELRYFHGQMGDHAARLTVLEKR